MNIVKDPWLPMRLQDGSEQVLSISQICRADVVDFALPRADFQGAAYQFAIGLLQTVFAPKNPSEWVKHFMETPTQASLEQALQKVEHAFHGEGDGPLFMQDYDYLNDQESISISRLLIEAPGENTEKENKDHFVKRGVGEQMSLSMALLALFTLQINAPPGGQGHCAGLRGGGPLTSLVLPSITAATLWQKLWLNVINRETWRYDAPDFTDGSVFPWLAATRTSEKKGSEIYADSVHPLHMFWAMPRRIRLEVQERAGECLISGQKAIKRVRHYRSKSKGSNYSGYWSHPLTPYRSNPKKPELGWWSIKGDRNVNSYKVWYALTFSSKESAQHCATVVSHFEELAFHHKKALSKIRPRLWVFGYDFINNMNARGWYSTTLPLFQFDPQDQDILLGEVKRLQKLSDDALRDLRTKVKVAWFKRPKDVKGDMSFIDMEFWQRTEPLFFTAISQLMAAVENGDETLPTEAAHNWLKKLQMTVMDLFDEYALSELISERSMEKRITARRDLAEWIYGGKDIKKFKTDYHIEQKEIKEKEAN